MKPVNYKECNVIMGKDQDEYFDLPAYKDPGVQGHVVTCWKFTFWERIRLLFGKNLWLSLMTFQHPFQPVRLTTKKSDILQVVEMVELKCFLCEKPVHVYKPEIDRLVKKYALMADRGEVSPDFDVTKTQICIHCNAEIKNIQTSLP